MPGGAGATNPGLAPVAAECEQKEAPFASTSADVREQLQVRHPPAHVALKSDNRDGTCRGMSAEVPHISSFVPLAMPPSRPPIRPPATNVSHRDKERRRGAGVHAGPQGRA